MFGLRTGGSGQTSSLSALHILAYCIYRVLVPLTPIFMHVCVPTCSAYSVWACVDDIAAVLEDRTLKLRSAVLYMYRECLVKTCVQSNTALTNMCTIKHCTHKHVYNQTLRAPTNMCTIKHCTHKHVYNQTLHPQTCVQSNTAPTNMCTIKHCTHCLKA